MAPSLTGQIASEGGIVEGPALALLQELGWTHIDLYGEVPSPANLTGRTSFRQPQLLARLRTALGKLNPGLPPQALLLAEAELTRDRSAMLPVAANREVHRLLVHGVTVEVTRDDGNYETQRVRVVDWLSPSNNDFVAASQVWIEGLLHKRRPDTIGYVNGLPLWVPKAFAVRQVPRHSGRANQLRYTVAHIAPRIFNFRAKILVA
jgi:type I restriction enzyme R subunit